MTVSSVMLGFSLALIAGAVAAQSPPQPQQNPADPPTVLNDVVVDGRRLANMAREFVTEVGEPANNRGLARWNRPICLNVVNLRPEAGQYIFDRISDVARDLGVQLSEPGCRPNILILATADGAALASAVVQDRPRNFDLRHNGTDAGARAFRDFRTGDSPVRWWPISMPFDSDTNRRAVRLPGDIDPATGQPVAPSIIVHGATRLRTQIRDDMIRSVIIVDVDRLGGADLVQLADYLALVALAQIDGSADTSDFPTILNLFVDPALAPAGLTDWDRSYLVALYQHDQLRINRGSQVRAVAEAVVRDQRTAAESESE